MGVIERIIPESGKDFENAYMQLQTWLKKALDDRTDVSAETLVQRRYARFRKFGALV